MASTNPENINHLVAVRFRVVGSGNLNTSVSSYDGVRTQVLAPTVLEEITDKLPNRLANFKSQRMQIMISTSVIDEWFNLHKIIAFVKPSATGYPQ